MDLVSIVIPVYNTGEPLRGCLESVINQTYKNLEIVVVDDQSSDPLTLDIMQEYAAKDSRIKLVHNEKNSGISFTRNAGVDNTTGKYLSFLDSDDKFDIEYVERMVSALEQNQTDLVMCHSLNYSEGDSIKFKSNDLLLKIPTPAVIDMQEFIKQGNLFKLPNVPYGKLIRLDLYKQMHIRFREDLRLWEDNEWVYNSLTQFKNFCTIDFVGVHRLIRPNSISHDFDSSAIYGLLDMAKVCYQSFKQKGYMDQYYDLFIDFVIGGFEYRTGLLKKHEDMPKLEQALIKTLQQFEFPVSEDLSILKRDKLKSKVLYTAYKLIGNKCNYKKYKVRYHVYKHACAFLQGKGN